MPAKTIQFTVRIRTPGRGHGDVPALLDMLRYESGRVVSWSNDADAFVVTIEVDRFTYSPDRWRSFGIVPQERAS